MQQFADKLLSQLLALIAFFAFPVLQYILLRRLSRKEGEPELWYLPKYGFRLVIRNKPRKRTLKDIKYIVSIIKTVPRSEGCSISTADARDIVTGDKLFLMPGYDQILLSFRLEKSVDGGLLFIQTDKFGNEKERIPVANFHYLRCDYRATIQNFFNFNVQRGKRVRINSSSLGSIYDSIQEANVEKRFEVDRVQTIG